MARINPALPPAPGLSAAGFFVRMRRMRTLYLGIGLFSSLLLSARAAEKTFEFDASLAGQAPPGFTNVLLGEGPLGNWQVVMDEVTPLLPRLSEKAAVVTRRPVLAQLGQEAIDEHFPILFFTGDTYSDFQLTTRFKLVSGKQEQMAGIVFRASDARNFYVIRVNGLGRNIRFYKVVNGVRGESVGREVALPPAEWHELRIECKAKQITCSLNGQEALPTLIDNTFTNGMVGFWTKSDAVTYFADTRLTYKSRIPFAQTMVNDTMAKQTRLKGLRIYTLDGAGNPKVLASKSADEVGTSGGKTEKDAIVTGTSFQGKTSESALVVMPLRDRNGEPMAAVWLEMESFKGQTEKNIVARAMPIVRSLQARVHNLSELTE
jgi:hypothetical protein